MASSSGGSQLDDRNHFRNILILIETGCPGKVFFFLQMIRILPVTPSHWRNSIRFVKILFRGTNPMEPGNVFDFNFTVKTFSRDRSRGIDLTLEFHLSTSAAVFVLEEWPALKAVDRTHILQESFS